MAIRKDGGRSWAVYDGATLVCVCLRSRCSRNEGTRDEDHTAVRDGDPHGRQETQQGACARVVAGTAHEPSPQGGEILIQTNDPAQRLDAAPD